MYLVIKRLLGLVISIIGLIILLPLFAIISIFIKLDSKGPVFFKQKRIGRDKKIFNMYKFRTMYVDAPSEMSTEEFKDAKNHITKVGKFLRKTSLDELPQLLNIIKGDMSIIGPRPALWNQYQLIESRDNHNIHTISPGLTGLAQINGRDEISEDIKVHWDKTYRENISFVEDFKIFILTVFSVLKSDGIVD